MDINVSYPTSDSTENVLLNEKGDRQILQGPDCMLAVKGVQSRV